MVKQIIDRPNPKISPEAQPFWDGVNAGELRYQRCTACGLAVWRPRYICPQCSSFDLSWTTSRGEGAIYSFSIVRRPPYQYWEQFVPYVVGLIEMDEGYHLFAPIKFSPADHDYMARDDLSNLEKMSHYIGRRVYVQYDNSDNRSLLFFALAEHSDEPISCEGV